jgi:hypothetical protein
MHFMRFSIRQALQGLWRNRVMNIAATVTMTLMLILLSALVIVITGVESGLEYIESRVEVPTLKTPWSPCSSASAIASDTSSSWMDCIIGSNPITVGTRRWRRYAPIIEWT